MTNGVGGSFAVFKENDRGTDHSLSSVPSVAFARHQMRVFSYNVGIARHTVISEAGSSGTGWLASGPPARNLGELKSSPYAAWKM